MSNQVSTTIRYIGKVPYLVCATSSENATEQIERKIEKLILKDLRLPCENQHLVEKLHPIVKLGGDGDSGVCYSPYGISLLGCL